MALSILSYSISLRRNLHYTVIRTISEHDAKTQVQLFYFLTKGNAFGYLYSLIALSNTFYFYIVDSFIALLYLMLYKNINLSF
jgi:hypothetical protein